MLHDCILPLVHESNHVFSDPTVFEYDAQRGDRQILRMEGVHNGTYLVSGHFQRFPVYPWENVAQERRVVFDVRLLKLGVLKMEGKRKGRSFACFDGTGQEIYCQNLHLWFNVFEGKEMRV